MKISHTRIWTGDFLTVFGFFLTALGTYLTVRSNAAGDLISNELFIIGCVIVILTILGWFIYYHKARLLKSVLHGRDGQNESHRMIQDLYATPLKKKDVQTAIQNLTEICQKISHSFGVYHERDIAVCIHYLNKDSEDNYYVNILCRNTDSKKRPESSPPAAFDTDYIDENTDFLSIMAKARHLPVDKIYYLNNFLPFNPWYRNSHFSEEMSKKYYAKFGWINRILNWELKYKSTLVVPLINFSIQGKRQIEGFLSIDSSHLWAFSEEYDLPIVLSLAKSLSPFVGDYNRLNLHNEA